MLRTVLVGATKTMPATMREINSVASATMYPTYVKGGGDYNSMTGKPSINGVELSGDLTFEDLGIVTVRQLDIDTLFD